MIADIFRQNKVPYRELYTLDLDRMIQLLSAFEGEQIYPPLDKELSNLAEEKL